MSLSILFFDGYPVNIVVSAERYDFQIWRDIVDYAPSYTVNVKVV